MTVNVEEKENNEGEEVIREKIEQHEDFALSSYSPDDVTYE